MYPHAGVFIGGDTNFKDVKWSKEGELLINSDLGRQQEILFSLCNRYLLTNLVDKPTRGDNLLDVILCNNRVVFLKCVSFLNVKFSDHNLVKVTLTVNTSCDVTHCENLVYLSVIPQYNWRQGLTQ